jgi:succinylarginine dihydrolase
VQTIAFDSNKASDLTTAVSDVATLQSEMTTAQSDLATNASTIATKQDILDGTNKLPIASVDLTGSTLVNRITRLRYPPSLRQSTLRWLRRLP